MQDSRSLSFAQTHPAGTPAVFEPGQEIRCPAPRRSGFGACGQTLRIWVGVGCRILLRPLTQESVRTVGSGTYHCRVCHHRSEVTVLKPKVELEATG